MLDEILARLAAMSPEDREATTRLAMSHTAGMRWVPAPGPQTNAFWSPADVLLYAVRGAAVRAIWGSASPSRPIAGPSSCAGAM